MMPLLPLTAQPLIIRTDFSDQAAWEQMITTVRTPAPPFIFQFQILEDPTHHGVTIEQLLSALLQNYPHSFMVIADPLTLASPDYPMVIVDLLDHPGSQFRAIAPEVATIENNLTIANMIFAEFAVAVDPDGVFRGFPRP